MRPTVVHAIGTGRATFWPALRYRQTENSSALVTDIDERLSAVYPFPKNLIMRRWENIALAQSDMVVVVSEEMQKMFSQISPSARLTYLPNAVDLEMFDRHADRAESVRQQLGGREIVTYMGFLLPRYRTDRVLRVARRVRDERPGVHFVIVGKGPERQRLEGIVRDLGIEDDVTFTGFVSDEDLPGYLAASDALLFPIEDTHMNRARCPNKTYVYCAARVPIVTNPVGEVHNALGEHARYFDYESDESFASAIIETLDTGQPRPPRELAQQHSWAKRTREYVSALNSLNPLVGAFDDVKSAGLH
jgi:glycosyltransferase involved in cell wall biosynthesis